MRSVARKENMSMLGERKWMRVYNEGSIFSATAVGVENQGYWGLWNVFSPINSSLNPYYNFPIVTKYYSTGNNLKLEMVNNDPTPMMVKVYRMNTKHTQFDGILSLLQQAKPLGLGDQYGARDATPFQSQLFTKYFHVYNQRTYKVMPGKQLTLNHSLKFGRKGSVIGKYMWAGSLVVADLPLYMKDIHEPLLIHFQPMLATTGEGTGYPIASTPPAVRFAIRSTYTYSWKELEDNAPSLDYITAFENATNLVQRAPGTLGLVSADAPITLTTFVPDELPVTIVNSIAEPVPVDQI